MSFTREEKLKSRLNFDGYTLYPIFKELIKGKDKAYFNFIKNNYGDGLFQYVKSISTGGSNIDISLPPVVCGPRECLDKFLALFLIMLEDQQGMKFGINDLKIIKSKKEEEEEEYTFINYPQIAILDLHKNTTDHENMEKWRLDNVLEFLTTRQRNRKPMVVLSEKPLGQAFADDKVFNYISLFSMNTPNVSNMSKVDIEHKHTPSTNSSIYDN